MVCFSPITAVKLFDKATGTYKVKVIGQTTNYEDYKDILPGERYFKVPCGKCIGCRLDYAKNWANRCVLEAEKYEFNEMLTLTYDEEHLPVSRTFETEEGIVEISTLIKKDLQDFFKRLRIEWERKHNWKKIIIDEKVENYGIRYYACGEYGEKNGRAHYHALMFNFPVFDKEFLCFNKKGNIQYTSKEIEQIWGKGRISLCEVNWETASYVARYIMKKQNGKEADENYNKLGQQKEFVVMSRNPGIARNYFEENKDSIYETDEIFIPTQKGIQTIKPSRYFDDLYDLEEPNKMKSIRRQREIQRIIGESEEIKKTNLKLKEYLKVKQSNKENRIQLLKREL